MSLRFRAHKHFSNQVPLTTAAVVIGPVDIREFDKFSLVYQNYGNGALSECIVQVAMEASATAAGVPPAWVAINSTTLPQPSALGATAVVATTAVDNTFAWLRVLAAAAASKTAGTFSIHIGGFTRT